MLKMLLAWLGLLLVQLSTYANMYNPYQKGSLSGLSFAQRNIDIVQEDMVVTLNETFEKIQFKVTYTVNNLGELSKVPIIFYAKNLASNFIITLDGVPITVDTLNAAFELKYKLVHYNKTITDSILAKVRNSNTILSKTDNDKDNVYFTLPVTKGMHSIVVTYLAKPYTNSTGYVKQYTIPYILAPAKLWKSFGKLTITIDATNALNHISTNLGKVTSGTLGSGSKAVYTYNSIPQDVIEITYTPQLNVLATLLTKADPYAIGWVLWLCVLVWHCVSVYYKLRSGITTTMHYTKYWLVILGNSILPIFTTIATILYINYSAGIHGGQRDAYAILYILFYPFFFLVHTILSQVILYIAKRNNK